MTYFIGAVAYIVLVCCLLAIFRHPRTKEEDERELREQAEYLKKWKEEHEG